MNVPMPNLHHLELFHHVVAAGGISAAVRAMPYGIQQPAVSGQISKLEQDLGVTLFQRRPFRLTAAGKELHEFLDPFFSRLPEVAAGVAGSATKRLRVTAPPLVIRDHLPPVLESVRREFPEVEISLRGPRHGEALRGLESGETDLAVIELEGAVPRGMKCEILATLPLVLWLPPGLGKQGDGVEKLSESQALIRPPEDTVMARLFERGLRRRKLHWDARMELATAELILGYVSRGFGVGLGHELPGRRLPKGVSSMPLPGFPPLVVAAMWRGRPGPLVESALRGLREAALTLGGRPGMPEK